MNLYKALLDYLQRPKKQLDEFVRSKNRHIAHDKEGKAGLYGRVKSLAFRLVQEKLSRDFEFHFTSEY